MDRPVHPAGHSSGPSGERGSAPPNDECANATPITLVDPSACATSMIAGTTAGTVASTEDPACETSTDGYADVWYSFNSGTHTEVLITLDPEGDISYWAFSLQTTCDPASGTACMLFPDPSVPVAITVAPNTDYLLRCFTNLDFGATPGDFLLCVAYQPFFPPPANDECTAPAPIAVVDIADCGTLATQGTTVGAPIVQNDPSCDNSNVGHADVWYTFNSGVNTEIYVTMAPGANVADWGFAVQSTCDPTTDIACHINPNGPRLVLVTPNTDYLVRCFNNLRYGARGEFTLCVAQLPFVAPPANDACTSAVPVALAVGSSITFTGDVSGATGTNDFEPGSE
ncbi:MAG TPA: hypothetical protein VHL57_01090, partial [Flavobacteriales bacterium]|nr:hypothetical protein [Flavobacteriales bacterium]